MVEESFHINKTLNVDPPCFVRKVDRRGYWKDAASIQNNVFCPVENRISVFLVESAMDLARVAIALNAKRSSMTEDIYLVAVTEKELENIQIEQAIGDTSCKWANQLHRNLVIENNYQTARLVAKLLGTGRNCKKFTKTVMKKALKATSEDGCHAAHDNSPGCVCEQWFLRFWKRLRSFW